MQQDGVGLGYAWPAWPSLQSCSHGRTEAFSTLTGLGSVHFCPRIISCVPSLCCAGMVGKAKDHVAVAVNYVVLAGKTPREAWELVGQPGGEAGIQNIRRHVSGAKSQCWH